jgi:hypothetical protein
MVHYIAPGVGTDYDATEPQIESSIATEPQIGSSIATARCTGLVALMLQCIAVIYGEKEKRGVRLHENLTKLLDHLAQDKYLQVWKIFDELNKPRANKRNYETDVLNTIADNLVKVTLR